MGVAAWGMEVQWLLRLRRTSTAGQAMHTCSERARARDQALGVHDRRSTLLCGAFRAAPLRRQLCLERQLHALTHSLSHRPTRLLVSQLRSLALGKGTKLSKGAGVVLVS